MDKTFSFLLITDKMSVKEKHRRPCSCCKVFGYQMWGAAVPQRLTCIISLRAALLVSRPPESSLGLTLVSLYVIYASLSHSLLCQEVQAGPAKKVYMSQCSGHQSGPAEPQFCSQRQHSQPGWAHTALSKLLWSVSLLHMFPKYVMCFYSLSQPGYINEGWGRERRVFGVRGTSRGGVRETKASLIQSSFVPLGCRGQLVISMQHLTIQIPVFTVSPPRSQIPWIMSFLPFNQNTNISSCSA